jgi:hypothetical protein
MVVALGCFYHPDREAVNTCSRCGQPICASCNFITGTHPICHTCWENRVPAPKKKPDKSPDASRGLPPPQIEVEPTPALEPEVIQEHVITPIIETELKQQEASIPVVEPELEQQEIVIPAAEPEAKQEEIAIPVMEPEVEEQETIIPEMERLIEQQEVTHLAMETEVEHHKIAHPPIDVEEQKLQEPAVAHEPTRYASSNISTLPHVANSFLMHIQGHDLLKNEPMPCPHCGESLVDPPRETRARIFARIATTNGLIFTGIGVGVVGLLLGLILPPFFLLVGLSATFYILIPYVPRVGAFLGTSYRCRSCDYIWTFKDAESYKHTLVN